jgi:hypothetical protein
MAKKKIVKKVAPKPENKKPSAFILKNKTEELALKHPPALKPKNKRAK